jgi:hypothetical protein
MMLVAPSWQCEAGSILWSVNFNEEPLHSKVVESINFGNPKGLSIRNLNEILEWGEEIEMFRTGLSIVIEGAPYRGGDAWEAAEILSGLVNFAHRLSENNISAKIILICDP